MTHFFETVGTFASVPNNFKFYEMFIFREIFQSNGEPKDAAEYSCNIESLCDILFKKYVMGQKDKLTK